MFWYVGWKVRLRGGLCMTYEHSVNVIPISMTRRARIEWTKLTYCRSTKPLVVNGVSSHLFSLILTHPDRFGSRLYLMKRWTRALFRNPINKSWQGAWPKKVAKHVTMSFFFITMKFWAWLLLLPSCRFIQSVQISIPAVLDCRLRSVKCSSRMQIR